MTVRIRIENCDAARTVIVRTETFDVQRRSVGAVTSCHLEPGAAREFYVHAAQNVSVTEDPTASRPAAPVVPPGLAGRGEK